MTEEQIGHAVIGAALKVHSAVGQDSSKARTRLVCFTNWRKELPVRRQVLVPIRYENLAIDNGYRIDLLIGDRVVVELKSIESILPVHRAQVLSYLRLAHFKLGYLFNFNVARMRDGIIRIVDGI